MNIQKKYANCPVCKSYMSICFSDIILRKYKVHYYNCTNCGLIQTEEPYWLNEAYCDAISVLDTGIIARNNSIAKKLALLLLYIFGNSGSYLDTAGGYGILTRIMRDIGFDFFWYDKYCVNIFAKGFEYNDNKDLDFNAVTAFEVLEHVIDPLEFICNNMKKANTDTIIFSTILYSNSIPYPKKWWYYSKETGQHITFYKKRTLKIISEKLDLKLYSNNFIHILTKRNINEKIIKIILSPLSEILVLPIRTLIKSKTMTDHQNLRDKVIKMNH